jgi:DNA-binding NtrC family response regulator
MSKKEISRRSFYRLNVVTVRFTSLRERGDDLSFASSFLKHFADENDLMPLLQSRSTRILKNYPWPGNIRELRNFCENLVVLKRGRRLPLTIWIPFLFYDSDAQSAC